MSWGIENKSHEKFNIFLGGEEKEIDIIISCDERSFLSLADETKTHFTKVGNEYRYSKLNHSYETVNKDKIGEAFPENQKLVCKGSPKNISIAELSEIIKTQKVIFYTGAGISAGAVPVMDKLMNDLKISEKLKEGKELQGYVADIIRNPNYYAEIICDFFDKCENAKPTTAHMELAKIVRSYGHLLVTENVDQLHQKTESKPIVFAGHDMYSKELKDRVRDFNFVITIGLNTDESGFLKWYKERNPAGKIISINLIDTCYLSDDDFSMKGDAQEIMRQLGELL
ncbi:hypothetical protein FACS189449_12570 [Alphaproteobacteria bacterium]|nr:hypothetical protein FACS189449_12570 [Alphaproteobacteria bacterium]